MRERQGVPASIEAIRVTWVIDASVGCALRGWMGTNSPTVPGDGRRRPARRAPWCAFPRNFGVPIR
jgi:hypothetical protein